MNLLLVLICGFLVFLFLKSTKVLIKKLIRKFPLWKATQKIFPLFEICIWIVFLFWSSWFLLKNLVLYPYILLGLILVVVAVFAWYFFRDIFAGAIFKAQNDLNNGDYIKIGSLSGQIKSMHYTHLEIISDKGQTIKIPNTKLHRELVTSMTTPEGMEEFKISLVVKKQPDLGEIEKNIKHEIVNSPWCNYKNPPVIKLQNKDAQTLSFDILVYVLNHQHLRYVEHMLKARFS
jgi:small-conductance mechanosensitive channel